MEYRLSPFIPLPIKLALRLASRCRRGNVAGYPAKYLLGSLVAIETRDAAASDFPCRRESGQQFAYLGQRESQCLGNFRVVHLAALFDVIENRCRVHGTGRVNGGVARRRLAGGAA